MVVVQRFWEAASAQSPALADVIALAAARDERIVGSTDQIV